MKKNAINILTWFLFGTILLGSALLRIKSYGDPGTSIGTVDTPVFQTSAQANLDSQFLMSGRPPTVPLIYKLFQPPTGFNLTEVSQPSAADGHKDLAVQADFVSIVWFQMFMSIVSWSALAFVLFARLQSLPGKLIAALVILAFAYTPQLAEWDHVLLSESISFSLFALLLALTIELAFRVQESRNGSIFTTIIYGILWLIVFIFWVFTRDANAYLIPVTILFALILLILPDFRKVQRMSFILGCSVMLAVVFYVQQSTMRDSQRWVLPFLTNVSVNVLPYPDRIELFQSMGMPVSNELLQLQSSMGGEEGFYQLHGFMRWARENGMHAYTRFLIDYPLWASSELFNDLELLLSENLQPWFSGPQESRPLWLIKYGDMLHPKTSAVVLMDILLTLMIMIRAILNRTKPNITWAWLVLWLLMGEAVLLFISFHGDARSTIRHTLVAMMPLRMSIWLLSVLIFDIASSTGNSSRIKSFRRK